MSDPKDDRKRPTLVFLPAMVCNDDLYQIERLRDLVEPMTLTVAEGAMAEAAAEVRRFGRPQNTASGFAGEPVPPTTRRGDTSSMNSSRCSSTHAFASGSSRALSTSATP
jgi:hypothetical protein